MNLTVLLVKIISILFNLNAWNVSEFCRRYEGLDVLHDNFEAIQDYIVEVAIDKISNLVIDVVYNIVAVCDIFDFFNIF